MYTLFSYDSVYCGYIVISWWIYVVFYPYSSWLIYWQCGNDVTVCEANVDTWYV